MEVQETLTEQQRRKLIESLPTELVSQCGEIAEELRTKGEEVRDEKILAARVRICSGYYDSEHVSCTIASRLLSEGQVRPD
jgi:hypothetical protein